LTCQFILFNGISVNNTMARWIEIKGGKIIFNFYQ